MSGSGAGQAPRVISRLQLLLVAAALLAFAGAIASAVSDAAPSEPGVQIKPSSGRKVFVGKSDIQANEDVPQTEYTKRTIKGSKGTQISIHGTSAAEVAALAGLGEGDFSYLKFTDANGNPLFLSNDEIFHPPYPEGPAVFFFNGDQPRFFRPVLNRNTGLSVSIDSPSNVDLLQAEAHTGNVLGVKISPTHKSIEDKSNVLFSAQVAGKLPGERVRLQWDFGDGTSPALQDPGDNDLEHYFRKGAGTYFVTATAVGSKDSGGISAAAKIVAGKAPSGPGSHGNGNGDGGDNHHGTTTTGSGGTPDGSTDGTDDGTGDGGVPNPYSPPAYTPPYDTSPYYPTTPTTPFTPDAPDSPSPPSDTPNPVDPVPALPPGVENVEGTLISDVSDISAPSGADAAASQEASDVQSTPTSVDLDQNKNKTSTRTLGLSAAGVLLLFFAGIGREMRLPRHNA